MQKQTQGSYTHHQKEIPVQLEIESRKDSPSPEIVVHFQPNTYQVKEDDFGYKSKLEKEVNLRYDPAAFEVLRFHEGVVYGIYYAYDIYTQETENPESYQVIIQNYPQTEEMTHGLLALAASHTFWQGIHFSPQQLPGYEKETETYFFPNTDVLPPYGKLTLYEFVISQKYLTKEEKKKYQIGYLEAQKKHFKNTK